MGILYVAVAAFIGGLVSAILGWLDSGMLFEARKFIASVLRAIVASVIFAIGYQLSGSVSIMDVFAAFVGGAGIDVIGNRLAGSINS